MRRKKGKPIHTDRNERVEIGYLHIKHMCIHFGSHLEVKYSDDFLVNGNCEEHLHDAVDSAHGINFMAVTENIHTTISY